MNEVVLSPKQYQSLLQRLDIIIENVLLIKFKSGQETSFIDSIELSELLHVSLRTLRRWRNTGRLPYLQLNKKVYYRVDLFLDSYKIHDKVVDESEHPQNQIPEHVEENWEMRCKCCPLLLLLTT
jgi:hypothetical protein